VPRPTSPLPSKETPDNEGEDQEEAPTPVDSLDTIEARAPEEEPASILHPRHSTGCSIEEGRRQQSLRDFEELPDTVISPQKTIPLGRIEQIGQNTFKVKTRCVSCSHNSPHLLRNSANSLIIFLAMSP
jgi:hypothetical protein